MPRTLSFLTDTDLAHVAEHLDRPSSALARTRGRPYATVAKARQRLAREGWVCRLVWTTCAVCGRPLATKAGAGHRTTHPGCVRERQAQLQRQYRVARPGQSTPYVRRYRAEHPERTREAGARSRDREREKRRDWPAERWEPLTQKLHESDQESYAVTLPLANASGAVWSAEEDRYVWEHLSVPARDVALHLGRTLWAVRSRRLRLRRRQEADG